MIKHKLMKKLILACLILVASFATENAMAQLPPTAGNNGPTGCFPPPCIPIDGGLSLLIAAGIGIAGKKAYDYSKQEA